MGNTPIDKKAAATLLPADMRQDRRQAAELLARHEGIPIPSDATTTSEEGDAPATFSRITLLTQELTEKAGGGPPSEEQIVRYYREHPNEYLTPEVRY